MSNRNRTQSTNKTETEPQKKQGLLPKQAHYTIKEVAENRGFHESTVRAWHDRGLYAFEQPGGPGGAFMIPRKEYLRLCGESTKE